jgi:hypothetical protein
LYCDDDGHVSKPFPDKPYCENGTGAVGVQNKAGEVVSFCQTVLPGNEAMLIPTSIEDWEQLAVPDPSYWCGTAAQYVESLFEVQPRALLTFLASTSILQESTATRLASGDRTPTRSETGHRMLLARIRTTAEKHLSSSGGTLSTWNRRLPSATTCRPGASRLSAKPTAAMAFLVRLTPLKMASTRWSEAPRVALAEGPFAS